MTQRAYLGIDSGTQSTKAILVDDAGNVLGRGQVQYGLIEGLSIGHKEQHPDTWVEALCTATADALRAAKLPGSAVEALGVSGQQHGFVPLDGAGEPIRPAKLWCDTSTAPEAADLIEAAGGRDAAIRETGNAAPAGFTASKILWLKRHEPKNFARLHRILLPHDFLNYWLTGEQAMEHGDASGTGLLDVRTRQWCEPAMQRIDDGLLAKFPPLIHSGGIVGRLRAQAATALGLRPGIAVSAGGGDNMMGAIGTGNVLPGVATVSLGTSGTVYAYSQEPIVDEANGEIAAFCDSTGHWLPLLCTMNVTAATQLVKSTFNLNNFKLNRSAESVGPGAGGLMLLPYFEGERTPDVPDGTGVWLGYSKATHTVEHFARAAMEGPSLGLAYGFNRMREMGIAPKEVRLTGGGSRSPIWRQILADAFDTPVVCTTEAEGAALGAAIQARWAVERERDAGASIADLCAIHVKLDETTRAVPDAGRVEAYRELLGIHNDLSAALRPVFARHRRFVSTR